MRGFNHIVGGLAFTGIFASFADVNLFSQPEYLGTCVFFSLLPDIDHTRSPMGKLFYPVAKWIDRHHGHRTVTHSGLCFLAVVLLVGLGEQLATGGRVLTCIAALAYASHLLFDMCTRQGIPLFLPFTRARCVLPGNPNLRLSNRSPMGEIAVFFVFGLLLLSTYPLMVHGFLSTVNNGLATFTRVLDEHTRHGDILELETEEGVSGEVVAATETGAVLWNGKRFVTVDEGHNKPRRFRHTNRRRKNERLEFVEVSADSLRKILARPVVALKAKATQSIRYRIAGQQYEQPSLELSYPQGFDFTPVASDNSATLGQIARLRATIAQEQQAQATYQSEQAAHRQQLAQLHASFPKLSEWEQGKATEKIALLVAALAAAKPPTPDPNAALAPAEIQRLKTGLTAQKLTFTGVASIWKP